MKSPFKWFSSQILSHIEPDSTRVDSPVWLVVVQQPPWTWCKFDWWSTTGGAGSSASKFATFTLESLSCQPKRNIIFAFRHDCGERVYLWREYSIINVWENRVYMCECSSLNCLHLYDPFGKIGFADPSQTLICLTDDCGGMNIGQCSGMKSPWYWSERT